MKLKVCGVILGFMLFLLILLPVIILKSCSERVDSFWKDYDDNFPINLYRQEDDIVVELTLEAYVAGVVAGEMPSSFEMEALKAQAVAARTYGLSKIFRAGESGNSGDHLMAPLCDGTHCQVYRSEDELLDLKGQKWMDEGWLKIKQAVATTAGQIMYYDGQIVDQPLFHSSSGGKTENSEDVFVSALPYLRSVESPYEKEAPHLNEMVSISLDTFKKKICDKHGASGLSPNTIEIIERSDGGRVKQMRLGNIVLTGREIRDLFNLRSANFSIAFDGQENIVFTSHGYGHGVGMSQWGANGMAKEGYGYKEILQHYYQGVNIK